MKKSTLIVFAIGFASLTIAVISFLIFDRQNISVNPFNGNFMNFESLKFEETNKNGPASTIKLEDFDKIEAQNIRLSMSIKKGNENRLVLKNMHGKLEYELSNRTLKFEQREFRNDEYLTLECKNPEQLQLTLNKLDGELEIDNRIKYMNIGSLNGVLDVETDYPFNIDLSKVNGVVGMNFDNDDATVSIDRINSVYEIFGEEGIGPLKSGLKKVVGEGTNKININNVNGVIEIR